MRKHSIPLVAFICVALSSCARPPPSPRPPDAPPNFTAQTTALSVYFSPNGGVTQAIVDRLESAKSSVRVLAYSFTSAPIAGALQAARQRGVDVAVILDKSQRTASGTQAHATAASGITVLIDSSHAIQHNKVIIIDGGSVLTGSFNFSKAAEERNAENLVIIDDPATAGRYLGNWQASHCPVIMVQFLIATGIKLKLRQCGNERTNA